jgi:hypothetical protein
LTFSDTSSLPLLYSSKALSNISLGVGITFLKIGFSVMLLIYIDCEKRIGPFIYGFLH